MLGFLFDKTVIYQITRRELTDLGILAINRRQFGVRSFLGPGWTSLI